VIDISARLRTHSIPGIPNPQGVVYAPDAKKLFVASSKGKLRIFDGSNFDLIKEIDFHGDVDNLRYDSATHRVYVGFGEEETGAIGIVDATTNQRLPQEYKLGAHPESFQLESAGPNMYVNLPDLKQIAVINRTTAGITRWPMTFEHNFPMALDETDHRLFVATHEPARMTVLDTQFRAYHCRTSVRSGCRRGVLRRGAKKNLCSRGRGLHQRVSTDPSGPLPVASQSAVHFGGSHRRLLWQRAEGV
jgi:DNA-binding beta-propeller fold protein YncE